MEDGRRSCDVVGKKPVNRGEATANKTVKTRDRGTQTVKEKTASKKRPTSADGPSSQASKTKKGPATATSPNASKKRRPIDAGMVGSPSKSPQKRAKVVDAQDVDSSTASKKQVQQSPAKRN